MSDLKIHNQGESKIQIVINPTVQKSNSPIESSLAGFLEGFCTTWLILFAISTIGSLLIGLATLALIALSIILKSTGH